MHDHKRAVEIVNEMVENGFHLINETADEFATRYDDDVKFMEEMLENVKNWRK